ncbi:MAG: FGGY-family carbohydrate kinase [Desulfobacterales bacterium]|nr:FGGY-family carbohydrate kinase [Desulfobacterales bacterium]
MSDMKDKYVLSLDCGTQSLRALVFDCNGQLLAREQVEYSPYVSPGPGLAEQDPEIYWDSLIQACRQLATNAPDIWTGIAGVGVTTQRATMVNVDAAGNVLRPAIVWLDQRTAAPVFGTTGILNAGVKLVGLEDRLMAAQAQGKCNWIRQNQPDIWASTHKYLQVSGFLNHRLTGVFADAVASQIGHLPFDYKRQCWAGKWALTRKLFPVETEKLPQLYPSGTVIGRVTAEASGRTGLPEGTPVVACGSDKGCETLGSGVVDETMISLSFGTTATGQTTSDRYFEAIPRMPPYPAPVPGCYNPEVEIFRGFWMISWFKKEFAHKEVETARELGVAPEELLNQCLERTQPGAMGLLVQPYWGPGLDHPDAKGAMIGFGDVHTRDHVYRAVIEGLGFALLEGLERLQTRGKIRVTRAALSGGASQSDAICQIAADIFNLPMVRAVTHETSGLGAAVLTARGTGIYGSIREAAAQMTRPAATFLPNPDHVSIYKALYTRVYKRMYKALSPLYKDIQQITGYPAK